MHRRNHSLLVRILIGLFISTAMVGYLYPAAQVNSASTPYQVYLPFVVNDQPPTIPDTTKVISDETLGLLSGVDANGSYTFSQSSPSLANIYTGDVIVGGISPATPEGFLRRVTANTSAGGKIILATEPATLEDAISDGSIDISQHLSPADLQGAELVNGVMLENAQSQAAIANDHFVILLDHVVLYDADGNSSTTDDQVTATGKMDFTADHTLSIRLHDRQLENMKFTFTQNVASELSLDVKANLINASKEISVAKLNFGTWVKMVGSVPVVYSIQMPVTVRLNGSGSIGVSTGVIQQAAVTAGMQYLSGQWSPIFNYSNQYTYTLPDIQGAANFKGAIYPKAQLKLYGLVAPYVAISPYLKLDIDSQSDPWWVLRGGIDTDLGVDASILGKSITSVSNTLLEKEAILAQPPSQPYPADGAVGLNPDVSLEWKEDGIHKDSMTYDVYLEAQDDTPDVLISSGQTDTFFTAKDLEPSQTYYWQVIGKDELGMVYPGRVWMFSTNQGGINPGEMVYIPAGTSYVGCDGDCQDIAKPMHTVYLDSFYIGKYEVTNNEYRECVNAHACPSLSGISSKTRNNYFDDLQYGNYPVIGMSYDLANNYCTWAGERLPTEAEWEKAARGTSTNIYTWGNEDLPNDKSRCLYGNLNYYDPDHQIFCGYDTLPVGNSPAGASPYGVMDILGNVDEWVTDMYTDAYGTYHLLHGGSFYGAYEIYRRVPYVDGPLMYRGVRCAKTP